MKRKLYEIDSFGFLKDIHIINKDENTKDNHLIEIDPPDGLFRPKWNGINWAEGATQEEINELTNMQPTILSDKQFLGQSLSEREIQEIIQGQQISDLEIRMLMGGL